MKIVVIKVGGSLFDLPDLAERLEGILRQRKDDSILLIAGGGAVVDLVRRWDRIHKLGEERSHWLALKAMGVNENLLQSIVVNSQIVLNRTEAEKVWQRGGISILNCCRFLKSEEATTIAMLPHTWEVTSDSIAAWVTRHWPADELLLLKSVDQKNSTEAVDAHFATLIPPLQNLS